MTQNREILTDPSPERMRYWGRFFDETLFFDICRNSNPEIPQFDPILAIHSSNRLLLESLQIVFPGRINPRNKNLEEGGNQEWDLRIKGALAAFQFLQRFGTNLCYTRRQAEIFEEFLLQKREVRRVVEGLRRVPRYPSPEDRIAVEEDLRERLLEAKRADNNPQLPLKPEELAGIFDAIGFFGIYSSRRQNNLFPRYQAQIGLVSTHRGLLEEIHRKFGGSEPVKHSQGEKDHIGPSFSWVLADSYRAIDLTEKVEPFMIFNHLKAKLIIEFLRVKQTLNRKTIPGDNFSPLVFGQDSFIMALRSRVLECYVEQWQNLKRTTFDNQV